MLNELRTLAQRFGNIPATPRQLKVVNSFIVTYTTDREERLLLLGHLFDRTLTTTKELSMGEASAIIDLAFKSQWEPNPEFIDFLQQEKQTLYAF